MTRLCTNLQQNMYLMNKLKVESECQTHVYNPLAYLITSQLNKKWMGTVVINE